MFVALLSCQNQIIKCKRCHEKHLYIYIYKWFHADRFSNMLWHYTSHHTVFNSNSIRKLIYVITIFKWYNTRNVKCKVFNQTVCRKICNLWLCMICQRDYKLPQPVKVSSPLCHIIHNQRLCIFQYVPLICYNKTWIIPLGRVHYNRAFIKRQILINTNYFLLQNPVLKVWWFPC